MYIYTWYQWITFFFIYCLIGWIFESTYVSLKKGYFVNRGFLRLPMLPLYGTGAITMLWVSLPVKDHLFLVYIFGSLAATALEYVTGYMMERLFKMKYWDYSNQRFQLHGYICLSSSIAWGFLTLFLTEVIHKPIEQFVLGINPIVNLIFVSIIGVLFLADSMESIKEALNLKRLLESMDKMKAQLEELQLQISLLKLETVQRVSDLKEDALQRAANFKGEAELKLFQLKKETELKNIARKKDASEKFPLDLEALTARFEVLNEKRKSLFQFSFSGLKGFFRRDLLRGNPTLSSKQFGESLKELKESLERKPKDDKKGNKPSI